MFFCFIRNLAGCGYSYFNCWMTYTFLMTKLKYVFSRISVAVGFNKYQSSPFVSVSHYGHQLWSGHRRQNLHDLTVFHPLFLCYSPAPPQPVPGAAFGLWVPQPSLHMCTPAGTLKGQGPDQLCLVCFCQLQPICYVELCVEVMHWIPFANAFCMPSAPKTLAASAHTLNTLCLFSMVVESEWTSKYVEQFSLWYWSQLS